MPALAHLWIAEPSEIKIIRMTNPASPHVLDRLVEPVARCFTSETARQLMDLKADDELQNRIDDLADRSTEGKLSPEERAEYETYIHFIDFVSLLQAKARRLVTENAPSNGSGL